MLLCIDVGNTHTQFGVYEKRKLRHDYRVASELVRTEDEFGIVVLSLLKHDGVRSRMIEGVGISSVVPNLTDILVRMSRKYFDCEALVVNSELDLGIKIGYDEPRGVGSDRICDAVAGYKKYGGPLIILDFGTATTYDVVSADGTYLGGAIAPGVETSAGDLQRRAAKLPRIELRFPGQAIGKTTVTSMQSGIMYGVVDAMEGMVKRIRASIGEDAKVIATGGFARTIASESSIIQNIEPALVLEGVRMLYEANYKRIQKSAR